MQDWGLNPGYLCARQSPYVLYCLSSPLLTLIYHWSIRPLNFRVLYLHPSFTAPPQKFQFHPTPQKDPSIPPTPPPPHCPANILNSRNVSCSFTCFHYSYSTYEGNHPVIVFHLPILLHVLSSTSPFCANRHYFISLNERVEFS